MTGFSFWRCLAVLRKEWIQVRRDPFTLRMVIVLPVMQLFLSGFAINANPRHLATGLLSVDHSRYERTLIAALHNTGYYDIRPLATEAEAERGLADGELLFVVNIPVDFDRSVDRGDQPAVLMDADATDPSAIGNAAAALAGLTSALDRDVPPAVQNGCRLPSAVPVRAACSLQPRTAYGAEYRSGTAVHRADDFDAVRDDAVDHAGNRAGDDGEFAGDAGASD